MSAREYRIVVTVPAPDAQLADDQVVAIAERIADELGASFVNVSEIDPETGRHLPVMAGSR